MAETGKGRNKIVEQLKLDNIKCSSGSVSSILKKSKESKSNQSTLATTAANIDTPTPTANQTPKSVDESTQSGLVYNISNSTESCQDSNSSISITDNIDNTGSASSKVHSEILDRVGHKPLNSPTLEEPVFMYFEAQDIDFADSDPDYNPDIYMKDLAVSTPQSVELKTPNEDKTSEGSERSEYDLGIEWDD